MKFDIIVRKQKLYRPDEDQVIEELAGIMSDEAIGKRLGRSEQGIKRRRERLHITIGASLGYLSAHQLANYLHVDENVVLRWIKGHDLPCQKQKYGKKHYTRYLISPEKFWEWANNNQSRIRFARIEQGTILPEPEWFKEMQSKEPLSKRAGFPWNDEEDAVLIKHFKRKTYKEIGAMLDRPESGVEKRVAVLRGLGKLKTHRAKKPNGKSEMEQYASNQPKKEEEMLLLYFEQGLTNKEIGQKLYLTESGVEKRIAKLRKLAILPLTRGKQ
ncbi:response regulator transcription factor [Paenibacillus cremeus]|uniref:Response regulator transcription factor n=1 Tax=Paenibacillus cremeus TaxID=2163881 RepID=A0A559K338_9BACL|nr:response regulator transcription factor [Paenibacillus cremeus]TVY06549.1 response regulator transcription factor [Paenibacillus cremeus]